MVKVQPHQRQVTYLRSELANFWTKKDGSFSTLSVLSTRVQKPNKGDWKKLVRYMKYLNGTKKMHLTLSAENLRTIKWYVDASFAVHPDFRSHTGAVMTMGEGGMQVLTKKQKLNSRSSTEAELIGVDDAVTQILWTKLFMDAQ